jgi:transposase
VRLDRPPPWSDEDERQLIDLYEDKGLSPTVIATEIHRSPGSVRGRLTKLRQDGRLGGARGRGGRTSRKGDGA